MAFFDAVNVADIPEDDGDFQPVPAGTYHVTIAGAEVKDTKSGNGKYISVRCDIIGPSHSGRVLFTNLNINNPNAKAEEIGRRQVAQIARAAGLASINDTDQMIGVNLEVKVVVKNDPQYGEGNEIKSFKAIGGSTAPSPSTAPAKAAASTAPWAK